MSQHDYVIDNQGFPPFRSDLNSALAAILSTNSGGSAPTPSQVGTLWADTTNKRLKIKNSGGNWTDICKYDEAFGGSEFVAATKGAFTLQNGLLVQWAHSGTIPYVFDTPNNSGNFAVTWQRNFSTILHVVGSQHTGFRTRMFGGVSAMSNSGATWTQGYEDPIPASANWTISFSVLAIGVA